MRSGIDQRADGSFVNNRRPVFLQKLTVHTMKDGAQKIEFEIPLAELDKTVGRIFDSIVVGLNDISRVEKEIFNLIDETKFLTLGVEGAVVFPVLALPCARCPDSAPAVAVCHWSPGPGGESIWQLKREVTGVFNRSIREAALLLSLYDEYAYLLDEEKRVNAYLKLSHTLTEYKDQIARYRLVRFGLSFARSSVDRAPGMVCASFALCTGCSSAADARARHDLLPDGDAGLLRGQ